MTENSKRDRLTGYIIDKSIMELPDPLFDQRIIKKIIKQKKQRAVGQYILSFSLLIILSALLILLSIPVQQPVTAAANEFLGINFLDITDKAGSWFSINMAFIAPIIVLIVLKMLLDLKFGRINKI